MKLFRISIQGEHETRVEQTLYGLASCAEEAMKLAVAAAASLGWESARVTEVYEVGVLSFQEVTL